MNVLLYDISIHILMVLTSKGCLNEACSTYITSYRRSLDQFKTFISTVVENTKEFILHPQ